MEQVIYVIRGVIKDNKQKQYNVGITAFDALRKGNAVIEQPIFLKNGMYQTFTNNINESVYFNHSINAINLLDDLRKKYLDFNFEVIECQMTLNITTKRIVL